MRAASAVRLAPLRPALRGGARLAAAAAPCAALLRQPAAAAPRRAAQLAPLVPLAASRHRRAWDPARASVRRSRHRRQRGGPPAPRALLGGDALQVDALPADVLEGALAAVEQLRASPRASSAGRSVCSAGAKPLLTAAVRTLPACACASQAAA
jgi:hypothetical protein